MKSFKNRWIPLACLLLVATTATLSVAQVGDDSSSEAGGLLDDIPADALKTAEGQRLADRLRILRRAEASIGPRHPSYKGIRTEIESIRERLGMRPDHRNSSLTPPAVSLNTMSEDELRQLIRRMALRIESLEKRLDALERRLEVF